MVTKTYLPLNLCDSSDSSDSCESSDSSDSIDSIDSSDSSNSSDSSDQKTLVIFFLTNFFYLITQKNVFTKT